MSLSNLTLGLYLILIGCIELFHISVPSIFLGVLALIAGIVVLVGGGWSRG